jgi:hypothetical protein
MRAKKNGAQLQGHIAENYWGGGVYTFSMNYHRVSSAPDSTWANNDVIEGYVVERKERVVVPGYFMFHRNKRKDFEPLYHMLPENVNKKQR